MHTCTQSVVTHLLLLAVLTVHTDPSSNNLHDMNMYETLPLKDKLSMEPYVDKTS